MEGPSPFKGKICIPLLLTITKNNQHLRFRVFFCVTFLKNLLPNKQNPFHPRSFNQLHLRGDSGFGKHHFQVNHSFIFQDDLFLFIFRWTSQAPCPSPSYHPKYSKWFSGNVSPPKPAPWSPPGSFETFATCQSKSGIYRKRLIRRKSSAVDSFGAAPSGGFLERKGHFDLIIFHDCVGFDIVNMVLHVYIFEIAMSLGVFWDSIQAPINTFCCFFVNSTTLSATSYNSIRHWKTQRFR